MSRTNDYFCKTCQLRFRSEEQWHPKCVNGCDEGVVFEIWGCDVCSAEYFFGDPDKGGIVANPDYVGGNRHEVLLDGKLFLVELSKWSTCYACCRRLLAEGKGSPVAPKTCLKCSQECMDMHGWDGEIVEPDGKCYGGYGSREFDMACCRFTFAPGWYCYDCLDTEVKEGRAIEL